MQTIRDNGSFSRFYKLFSGLMRQNRSGVLLYSGILFGIYTVPTLIAIFTERNFFRNAVGAGHNFSAMSFVFFTGYMIIVPIALGGRLFGYMHSKRAVDLYHALPVTRSELYLAYTGVGCVTLALPVAFNLGLIFITQVLTGAGSYVPAGLLSLVLWMVSGYTLFAITGFCAVNTGSPMDTTLFSLALNGAPAAIYLSMLGVNSMLLYGFYSDEMSMVWASRLSPLPTIVLREIVYSTDHMDPGYYRTGLTMLVWAVLALLITGAALMVYKRRKSEIAEVVGNLGPAQILVRVLIYYLGILLFAMFFYAVLNQDREIYFTLGAVIGAMVTGLISESILTRSPKTTLRRLPSILAVAAVAGIGSYLYLQSGFGYETYLPEVDALEGVQVSFQDGYREIYGLRDRSDKDEYFEEDPEVLRLLTQAHGAQLAGYMADDRGRGGAQTLSSQFRVTYKLKNGRTTTRSYYGIYTEAAEPLIRLSMQPSYVAGRSGFFQIDPQWIGSLGLLSPIQDTLKERNLTADQKVALIEAIRADLLSRDADAMMAGVQAVGLLDVNFSYRVDDRGQVVLPDSPKPGTGYTNQDSLRFTVYEGDSRTIAFLEENDLLNDLQADYSTVTELFVVDNASYHIRYSGEGPLAGLNDSIASSLFYNYESFAKDEPFYSDGGGYYENGKYSYYGSVTLRIDSARTDELVALSKATVPQQAAEDTLIIAFRTEQSAGRIGYLYIDRALLPTDIADEIEETRRRVYEDFEKREFYAEHATQAVETQVVRPL